MNVASVQSICLANGVVLNNRYCIASFLGCGGFSITYTAWDQTLEVDVVIKEYLPKEMLKREKGTTDIVLKYGEYQDSFNQGVSLFLKEAKVLAKLTGNDRIANVTDYFSENNTAYIVMPYYEGVTLENYVKNNGGRISARQTLELLTPVIQTLSAVHQMGIIHRDISPDNIMITGSGKRAVLLDFGICSNVMNDMMITDGSNTLFLKRGYSPPEQYLYNGVQGSWTDVYSMAATFWYCISGSKPEDAVDRMQNDLLPWRIRHATGVPGHTKHALVQALSLCSKDRYRDMNGFLKALKMIWTPSWRKGAAALAAAALVFLGGVVAADLWNEEYSAAGSNPVSVMQSDAEGDAETSTVLKATDEVSSEDETADIAAAENETSEENGNLVMAETSTEQEAGDVSGLQDDMVIEFADANLEAGVREAIGKAEGDILVSDVSSVTSLNLIAYNIEDLSGLEYFTDLSRLDLSINMVRDLSPLAGLTGLTYLALENNLVEDITPLGGLYALSTLELSSNNIKDIAVLENLLNLSWLCLTDNRIEDVSSLQNLPKLKWLNISGNYVTDVSCLAQCPNLEEVAFTDMGIEDISAFDDHPMLTSITY